MEIQELRNVKAVPLYAMGALIAIQIVSTALLTNSESSDLMPALLIVAVVFTDRIIPGYVLPAPSDVQVAHKQTQ
jgi:hypothetical protein